MRFARPTIVATSLAPILLSMAVSTTFAANTWRYVDNDGWGSATGCGGHSVALPKQINTALAASSNGDTVIVCPGRYKSFSINGKSDITVRGLTPWTATIRDSHPKKYGFALAVADDSPRAKIQWLNFSVPVDGPCVFPVGAAIAITNSPDSQVRSNHIKPFGSDTFGACGYGYGIFVEDSPNTHVLWNRVTDFTIAGIQLSSDGSLVRGNTVRFFHANAGSSILASGIILDTETSNNRVLGNVVEGLSSAGVTTPILEEGIIDQSTTALIKGNSIRYVYYAINLQISLNATVRDNRTGGVVYTGIQFQSATGANIFDNRMAGSAYGINAGDGSGNSIHDNDFRGPSTTDCVDPTIGGGNFGTSNNWFNNLGSAIPAGICTEP